MTSKSTFIVLQRTCCTSFLSRLLRSAKQDRLCHTQSWITVLRCMGSCQAERKARVSHEYRSDTNGMRLSITEGIFSAFLVAVERSELSLVSSPRVVSSSSWWHAALSTTDVISREKVSRSRRANSVSTRENGKRNFPSLTSMVSVNRATKLARHSA